MKEQKSNNLPYKEQVEKRERRKIRVRREGDRNVWFGLGMFGMVGWTVAVPTVLLTFTGVWIDSNWPGQYSWTLMLLFIGLVIGCANAWYWIQRERRDIGPGKEDNNA